MNKKLIIIVLVGMVLYLTISGSSAYTDGELVFEDTMQIEGNSYQSRTIELNSSELDPYYSNQGFNLTYSANITTHLDLLVLENETKTIPENVEDYGYLYLNISSPVVYSYGYYKGYENSTTDDLWKFVIILYNRGNESVNIDLQILYAYGIIVLDSNGKANFSISILILSMTTVTYVRSIRYYRRKNKI